MGFLAPLFLAGLAAISIPVVIHLIHRERRTVVEFPSLMFLQRIPYRSVRRQKLRHLFLLALRCIALAAIAAAFARPFLHHDATSAATSAGAREVVLLLDNSYSMGYGDRWNRALDSARAAVEGLGSADRATVVLFANDAAAVSRPTRDRAVLEAAIRAANVSSEGTRYAPALRLASQILSGSNMPQKEVVIVSDFQRAGWARREEMSLPAGVTLRAVDLGGGDTPDIAVSQVTTDRDRVGQRDRVAVAARLTNVGDAPKAVQAVLELSGREAERRRVTVPARGVVQVRFAAAGVPSAATSGTVRIDSDSLRQNDQFNFTVAASDAISVLVLQPARARENQSLFVTSALAIGETPAFDVDVQAVDDVRAVDLNGRSLVILNEVAPPRGAVGSRLREMISAGAGLLLVPGDELVERWPAEWRQLIPGTAGAVVDRTPAGGGNIASLNFAHPIFEPFSAPRSGDFSVARVFRYRKLDVPGDSSILARFDDGSPALVEKRVGSGKVLVWTSSLDSYWTDLPLQPVFLPLMHQIAKHAGGYSDARAWFTAGDVLDLSRHPELLGGLPVQQRESGTEDQGAELVLEAPSGSRARLHARGTDHLAPLSEQGFYELRSASTPVGSGRPIAVNVDIAEADLSHFDPRELITAVLARPTSATASSAQAATPREQERRQAIWWYLLLGGLVLLAWETVLSNRLSRAST